MKGTEGPDGGKTIKHVKLHFVKILYHDIHGDLNTEFINHSDMFYAPKYGNRTPINYN
jgi:hypothetical protein